MTINKLLKFIYLEKLRLFLCVTWCLTFRFTTKAHKGLHKVTQSNKPLTSELTIIKINYQNITCRFLTKKEYIAGNNNLWKINIIPLVTLRRTVLYE
jgi:hypothetical protein